MEERIPIVGPTFPNNIVDSMFFRPFLERVSIPFLLLFLGVVTLTQMQNSRIWGSHVVEGLGFKVEDGI